MKPQLSQFQITTNHKLQFQAFILGWFARYGRTEYPWRRPGITPYEVLISEVMLQQTQTDRVIPKYLAFLERFPSAESLADATTAQVVSAWQGLGYNRRGLNVQKAAREITSNFDGIVPESEEDLQQLSGIGPYTAAAIRAFAFNKPSIVIETNIRSVVLYHFFPGERQVGDDRIREIVEATLLYDQPREWYSALMDYGAFIKKVVPNPSQRSKSYAKQSKFKGSDRQVRGQVIRSATQTKVLDCQTLSQIAYQLDTTLNRVIALADALVDEGFLKKKSDEKGKAVQYFLE